MCYPVYGMMHIKEPLLLIGKSSPCGGGGFPLSLSEWSFTICPTPYNRKIKCVECVVKKIKNISFLPSCPYIFFFFFFFFFFKKFIGPETNMVSVRVGAPISLPYNHIIF